MRVVVALVVCVVAGCSSKAGTKAGSEASNEVGNEASNEACVQRADAIGARLTDGAGPPPLLELGRVRLPRAWAATPVDVRGPVVRVDDGDPVAIGAGSEPVYLLAREDDTVGALAERVGAIVGRSSVRLLVGQRTDPQAFIDEVPPALREYMDELLNTSDASQKAALIAQEVEKAIGSCKSVASVFEDAAGAEANRKSRVLADGIGPGLRECGCAVSDLDRFEYLLRAVVDMWSARQGYVPLRVGVGAAITMSSTATVGELLGAAAMPGAMVDGVLVFAVD